MTEPDRPSPFTSVVVAALVCAVAAGCASSMQGAGGSERDPNVRGVFSGYFMWAVSEPTLAIEPIEPGDAAALVDRAAATIDDDRDSIFSVSIAASFPTAEAAAGQATAVRKILADSARWYADPANGAARAAREDPDEPAPFTPPEIAALEAKSLAPAERGVGWGGDEGDVDDAVYTIGPILVITGIKREAPPEGDDPAPLHPLAHLLAAEGGSVLLEGADLGYGDSSIVADLSCRPVDAATGTALLDELGDAISSAGQFHARPPWIGPPIIEREALARATFRRWQAGAASALADPKLVDLASRLATAQGEERQAIMDEFSGRLAQRGLEELEGEFDPGVLALLIDGWAETDTEARARWAAEVGSRMGSLPLETTDFGPRPSVADYERLALTGSLRVRDGGLEIGWLMFGRLAAGLPLLAGYLTERGCSELRVGLVDYEEVRGD
ncbi:MAG TPA: hypothetical protein VK871_00705 [Candidatus Limnocylindrales bacterium]|nr:hypothetical protein [Candidatus Limnocylindrales bacterium]